MGTPKTPAAVYRITIDIPQEDAGFLHQYADYRNAMAAVLGIRLKRVWTRKGLAEALFTEKIDSELKALLPIREACGEIPPAGDAEAMLAYAKKVAAWTERREAEQAEHKSK